ncbi:hypothetical protein [Microbacterium schleiferi]|uniref:Uncharacterized protein n=1 Tax=Microbacterium schleiferi TaxID=69362 RepID=A0ABU7V6K3_9MICO
MTTRPRLRKMVISLATLSLVVAGVSGCAAPVDTDPIAATADASPSPTRSPSVRSTPSASATPAPSVTSKLGPAVVLAQCKNTSSRLLDVRVAVKSVRETPVPAANICGGTQPPIVSRDGKLVAFAVKQAADNSSHVGWYENGKEVDVTATLARSGGALGVVRQDMYPTFDWEGNFVFMDTNAKKLITVSTKTRAVLKEDSTVIRDGRSEIYGPFIVSADGSYSQTTGDFTQPIVMPGDPNSRFCPRWRNYVQFYPGDGSAVLADLSVVRDSHTEGGSGCNDMVFDRALIPETDFTLSGTTYDPDTGTVYFLGMRGSECYLFSVPLSGGEAKRVMDLSDYSANANLRIVGFHP